MENIKTAAFLLVLNINDIKDLFLFANKFIVKPNKSKFLNIDFLF